MRISQAPAKAIAHPNLGRCCPWRARRHYAGASALSCDLRSVLSRIAQRPQLLRRLRLRDLPRRLVR